jgi:hypothetical protein
VGFEWRSFDESEDDALPVRVKDRADVVDSRGDPELVRAGMSIDDPSDDGLGHASILSVHDREKGSADAGSRVDGIDGIGVESSLPLGGANRERDDGNPRRQMKEDPGVVSHGVPVRIVGCLDDDGPQVVPVGRREEHGDRSHRVSQENDALLGEAFGVESLYRRAHVLALAAAESRVATFTRAVTAEIGKENAVPALDEGPRVLEIALEVVSEPVNDDDGGELGVAPPKPRPQAQPFGLELDFLVAGRGLV